MKVIKSLVERMQEELCDADFYYHMAVKYKEEMPNASQVFIDLATNEIAHADKLHVLTTNLISRYNKEAHEAMKAIWEYEHEKIIEDYDELKFKISKFSL